jgi:hypothetical protein
MKEAHVKLRRTRSTKKLTFSKATCQNSARWEKKHTLRKETHVVQRYTRCAKKHTLRKEAHVLSYETPRHAMGER